MPELLAPMRRWIYDNREDSRFAGAAYKLARELGTRRSRRINVAMFHVARCGSTVLSRMINQHRDIDWANELFVNYGTRYPDCGHSLKFAKKILAKSKNATNCDVYGFETNYLPNQHLGSEGINTSLDDYVAFLKQTGFSHFIVLHRRNYLRRAISIQVGVQKGLWHSTEPVEIVPTVHLPDVPGMPDWFRTISKTREYLHSLLEGSRYIDLCYEDDICLDPKTAYLKVCSFLEMEPIAVDVALRRTNDFPLGEQVLNLDEVREVLCNTEFAWMLDG